MPDLDTFMEMQASEDATCSECSRSGAFKFWRNRIDAPDGEEDSALCGACLLNSTDGRFKNESPARIIREKETVKQSYITQENTLCIETTSFLGDFTHVFYLEDAMEASGAEHSNEEGTHITATKTKQLTGESEVFCETDEFVYEPSVYQDIAVEVLQQYNR